MLLRCGTSAAVPGLSYCCPQAASRASTCMYATSRCVTQTGCFGAVPPHAGLPSQRPAGQHIPVPTQGATGRAIALNNHGASFVIAVSYLSRFPAAADLPSFRITTHVFACSCCTNPLHISAPYPVQSTVRISTPSAGHDQPLQAACSAAHAATHTSLIRSLSVTGVWHISDNTVAAANERENWQRDLRYRIRGVGQR